MEDYIRNNEENNYSRKHKASYSPLNPSNGSILSGMSSLNLSPSNIASSTTQSNYINQFTRNSEAKSNTYEGSSSTPISAMTNPKGIFSKFMYSKPEILKEISPKYYNMNANK